VPKTNAFRSIGEERMHVKRRIEAERDCSFISSQGQRKDGKVRVHCRSEAYSEDTSPFERATEHALRRDWRRQAPVPAYLVMTVVAVLTTALSNPA
jgi:hypothetical protein